MFDCTLRLECLCLEQQPVLILSRTTGVVDEKGARETVSRLLWLCRDSGATVAHVEVEGCPKGGVFCLKGDLNLVARRIVQLMG